MDFLEICAHGNIFNEHEEAILRCQSIEEANRPYLALEEAVLRSQSVEKANQVTKPPPYSVPASDKCMTRGLSVVLGKFFFLILCTIISSSALQNCCYGHIHL
jgi:hypothetical protein